MLPQLAGDLAALLLEPFRARALVGQQLLETGVGVLDRSGQLARLGGGGLRVLRLDLGSRQRLLKIIVGQPEVLLAALDECLRRGLGLLLAPDDRELPLDGLAMLGRLMV